MPFLDPDCMTKRMASEGELRCKDCKFFVDEMTKPDSCWGDEESGVSMMCDPDEFAGNCKHFAMKAGSPS